MRHGDPSQTIISLLDDIHALLPNIDMQPNLTRSWKAHWQQPRDEKSNILPTTSNHGLFKKDRTVTVSMSNYDKVTDF
ncbi:uncharacterized protein APUU_60394S [Aspergillus puulaauensis]|uniref:Uncharacterized protein n=1 Tax=Aspergillus puulaauensis TaxID=1220207 RepID=A0A7R7XTA4_9EURO|nr:uncharacterized protein APUU_60394S [Aspergillus puulaauensis]BCS27346.1 hypothetical protein APUU_60394S [Aspergillus puulaauensis]